MLNCFLVTPDKAILHWRELGSHQTYFLIFLQQIIGWVSEHWSALPIPTMDLVLWLWKQTIPFSGPWPSKAPMTDLRSCASDLICQQLHAPQEQFTLVGRNLNLSLRSLLVLNMLMFRSIPCTTTKTRHSQIIFHWIVAEPFAFSSILSTTQVSRHSTSVCIQK